MIVEFAATLSLALSNTGPDAGSFVKQVEFVEPVQQVLTYSPVGVLNQRSGLPLPEGTLEAYETGFLDGSAFFAAFAITKDFRFGYVTGANSIEAARDIAIAECQKQGPACLIYAEILPQGYVPLTSGQISLAAEAAEYYINPNPEWGSFRAMAVSEDGAYSVVWDYGSAREASDAAMADCNGYVVNDLPDLRAMPCVLVPLK